MKKIDNWLSIQRYVAEASQATVLPSLPDVEVWGRVQTKHTSRKTRRFFIPRIRTI